MDGMRCGARSRIVQPSTRGGSKTGMVRLKPDATDGSEAVTVWLKPDATEASSRRRLNTMSTLWTSFGQIASQ